MERGSPAIPTEIVNASSAFQERALDARTGEPTLVGIRHLINVEPDADWIIRRALEAEGYGQVAAVKDQVALLGKVPKKPCR